MLGSLLLLVALAGPPRLAVLDLEVGAGVAVKDPVILTEAFAAALQDDAYRLLTVRDVTAMLDAERRRQILGCSGDGGCLAEVGTTLGADGVVVASIGAVGDTTVVAGRIVDSRTSSALARSSVEVGGGGVLNGLQRLAYELRKGYRRARKLAPPPEASLPPPPPPVAEAPKVCANPWECDSQCTASDPKACLRLSQMLETEGTFKDARRSAEALARACELGVGTASCERAGQGLLAEGKVRDAIPLLLRACEAQPPSPRGCELLVSTCQAAPGDACEAMVEGMERSRTPSPHARAALEAACRADALEPCRAVARFELAEAADVARRACAASLSTGVDACVRAALDARCTAEPSRSCLIAADARTVTPDADDPRFEAGVTELCRSPVMAGICARTLLRLVPERSPHPERAARELEAACVLGEGLACARAARLQPDPARAEALVARAVTLYEARCQNEVADACEQVAVASAIGRGAPKDERRAAELRARAGKLYREGCAAGDAGACSSAARFADEDEAAALRARAAELRKGSGGGKAPASR